MSSSSARARRDVPAHRGGDPRRSKRARCPARARPIRISGRQSRAGGGAPDVERLLRDPSLATLSARRLATMHPTVSHVTAHIPKNRCRTTIAERMMETLAELPFIGDQVVCLSHEPGRPQRNAIAGARARITKTYLIICNHWKAICWPTLRGHGSPLGVMLRSRRKWGVVVSAGATFCSARSHWYNRLVAGRWRSSLRDRHAKL